MTDTEQVKKWHEWAATKVAEYGDAPNVDMLKCRDDELRSDLDDILKQLFAQANGAC